MKIGVNDTFGESGPAVELIKKYGLDADSIYAKVKRIREIINKERIARGCHSDEKKFRWMAAFFDRHTFGRSCRWQALEILKYVREAAVDRSWR